LARGGGERAAGEAVQGDSIDRVRLTSGKTGAREIGRETGRETSTWTGAWTRGGTGGREAALRQGGAGDRGLGTVSGGDKDEPAVRTCC
jgi:hypothetical protein